MLNDEPLRAEGALIIRHEAPLEAAPPADRGPPRQPWFSPPTRFIGKDNHMRRRMLCLLALAAAALGLTAWSWQEKLPEPNAKDRAAIAKNGEAFVGAFAKGDGAALAALWGADGDYTDPAGQHLKGRAAIEKAFRELFAEHKGLRVRIESLSLRFVTPDVAVEDGTSEVYAPGGAGPTRARYTIVHVKKGGKWFLSSVREAPPAPGNTRHLAGLEWALGEWASEADKAGQAERLVLGWSEGQHYIVGTLATTRDSTPVSSTRLRIGWDPAAKRIRSWLFDASGGFGEGSWSRDGKKWLVKTASVLADGKKAAATFVLTHVDADTITWHAKDRTVDGKALPDGPEVKLKRVK
jgi:uncharacterized protein (TIGR02246 family)